MGPEWEQAVGRFVLALGDIERTTIMFLSVLPDCAAIKLPMKIPLRRRFEIVAESLARHPEQVYIDSLSALKVAEELIPSRNFVAHNGLSLSIHADGDFVKIVSHLESARDRTKRLSLVQMQELAGRADRAAFQLGQTWADLALYLDPSLSNPDR